MRFTAVGDAIIQRRIPSDFLGYCELARFIAQGDARFFNLETVLCREGECPASYFSGGTYLRADPDVLSDLKRFCFNMTSFNNNHTLDFSYDGLFQTLNALEGSGLCHAGVGKHLSAASAPRYLETSHGRVALISVNTSFEASMLAGDGNGIYPGRAGINGLRIEEKLIVRCDEFEFIKSVAKSLRINTDQETARKEGYIPQLSDRECELGELKFELGEMTERRLLLNEKDMARIEKAIYEASFFADYVMISVHSHEIDGDRKENAPKFLTELSHRVIDMGADAVVGHGPHLLRPIEIYKDRPIFYSLGDFILELYSVPSAPADFFERYGMDADGSVRDLLEKRSQGFTVGLMEDKRMSESVIACWETDGKVLTELSLLPIKMKMDGKRSETGLPRKSDDEELVENIKQMTKKYGMEMSFQNDGTLYCKF